MSIDVDILPTIVETAQWGNLVDKLRQTLGTPKCDLLGEQPLLLELGSNRVLSDEERLEFDRSYYFVLPIPNTLSITVASNHGNVDEQEYLSDYGRNLTSNVIQILARQWQIASYSYGLTTMAGRSQFEPDLFVALAAVLADMCQGHVVVMNDDEFDVGVGVYTSNQFQLIQPKFGMNFHRILAPPP